jgi:hypothetical protein
MFPALFLCLEDQPLEASKCLEYCPLPMDPDLFPRGYRITILQEPRTGAAHGLHYLSRVPLAPALIARLDVVDMTNRQLQV